MRVANIIFPRRPHDNTDHYWVAVAYQARSRFMKPFVKFVVIASVAGVGGLFFIQGPGGEPILTVGDLKPEVPANGSVEADTSATVYKWQDEYGNWQFSTERPEGVAMETVELDGQINTVPAVKAKSQKLSSLSAGIAALPKGVTSVSPDKIAKMTEAAQQIEAQAAARKKEIDRALGK